MRVPDFDAAERFLAANARVLDRRRFQRLFAWGDALPVRDVIAAYRNDDGGFGHALEPDGRMPAEPAGRRDGRARHAPRGGRVGHGARRRASATGSIAPRPPKAA